MSFVTSQCVGCPHSINSNAQPHGNIKAAVSKWQSHFRSLDTLQLNGIKGEERKWKFLVFEWHNFSLRIHTISFPIVCHCCLPTFKMAKAINLFNLSFSRHYLSALCSLPSIFISNNTPGSPSFPRSLSLFLLLADVKLKIPAVIQDWKRSQ